MDIIIDNLMVIDLYGWSIVVFWSLLAALALILLIKLNKWRK